jgi:hypothetical protein
MKWVLANSNQHQQVYELWNNEEKLMAFSHHVIRGTIRIVSDDPRVFQLRKEGFLKNRTVLLNEYGIKLATLFEETETQNGLIEMEQKKFRYSIHNRLYKEVFIYAGEEKTPLFSCDLPSTLNHHRALLLVLCWFNLQPQKKGLLQPA